MPRENLLQSDCKADWSCSKDMPCSCCISFVDSPICNSSCLPKTKRALQHKRNVMKCRLDVMCTLSSCHVYASRRTLRQQLCHHVLVTGFGSLLLLLVCAKTAFSGTVVHIDISTEFSSACRNSFVLGAHARLLQLNKALLG